MQTVPSDNLLHHVEEIETVYTKNDVNRFLKQGWVLLSVGSVRNKLGSMITLLVLHTALGKLKQEMSECKGIMGSMPNPAQKRAAPWLHVRRFEVKVSDSGLPSSASVVVGSFLVPYTGSLVFPLLGFFEQPA